MGDFDDFMTDRITVEALLSKDSYGTPSYNSPVTYACRIDGTTKQRVSVEGVERSVNAMIYIPNTPAIGPTDRITMPAGFSPQQPPILRVGVFTDESGPHHLEVAV